MSKIEWCDATWKLYAHADDPALMQPLHWRKARRVSLREGFDLFGEDVTDAMRDRVSAVMALCPQHTFMVLTKRPEAMLGYFASFNDGDAEGRGAEFAEWCIGTLSEEANEQVLRSRFWIGLPNFWPGVSVEDQGTADARIPLLLQTPAAVRFVSYEPPLGPVDFERIVLKAAQFPERGQPPVSMKALTGWRGGFDRPERTALDLVIVGGESGPKARPCNVEWIRQTVRQCAAAGVACFVKQLGAKPYEPADVWHERVEQHGIARLLNPRESKSGLYIWKLKDRKGGDMDEWPEDLRVRQLPGVTA